MNVDLITLVNQFLALGGVGALIAVIVNILKAAGLVKDGQAPLFVTGLGIAGVIALLGLNIFRPGYDVNGLDETARQIAMLLEIILGFVVQILAARATHRGLAGTPVFGKSFTLEWEKAANILVEKEIERLKKEGK